MLALYAPRLTTVVYYTVTVLLEIINLGSYKYIVFDLSALPQFYHWLLESIDLCIFSGLKFSSIFISISMPVEYCNSVLKYLFWHWHTATLNFSALFRIAHQVTCFFFHIERSYSPDKTLIVTWTFTKFTIVQVVPYISIHMHAAVTSQTHYLICNGLWCLVLEYIDSILITTDRHQNIFW